MSKLKSPLMLFFVSVLAIVLLALFGPEEQSLGSNVRIVYLHGAWVLTAEIAFMAAGLAGLVGLIGLVIPEIKYYSTFQHGYVVRKLDDRFHTWSAALGRTGIVFWVTYLPLSLFAMQANWNGLFLAEPRFRMALTFAVVGVLLQAGLWMMSNKVLTSIANLAFIIVLRVIFATAANIMHPPPSPIFNSGNFVIIGFFLALNLLALVAAYFMTRWFLSNQRISESASQRINESR